MKPCIQCNERTDRKFCPNCGQKQNIARLTLSSFFSDFFSRVYGLDGAFPRTLVGLARNPAIVAREYIKGIRGKYVGPVGYYFLMFAIFLLVVQFSDYTLEDYLPKTEEYADSMIKDNDMEKGQRVREMGLMVKQKVFNNIQYVAVFIVPFVALWCGIWFKKTKYNFLENAVFVFFIHAQAIIINILGFLFFISTGCKNNGLISGLSMLYYIWSINLFYVGKVQFGAVLKATASYILAYISFFIFVTLMVIIGLVTSSGFG